MTIAEALDLAILVWLVATWIYERARDHRTCAVETVCASCRKRREIECYARGKENGR